MDEIITEYSAQQNISESMKDIQKYSSSSSSDSDSDSEEDSVEDSNSDSSDENDIQKREIIRSNKKKPEEEESWLSVLGVDKVPTELPDIASLEIKDKPFLYMGKFENIIDKIAPRFQENEKLKIFFVILKSNNFILQDIVTVAGFPNFPTFDLDTLLFVEEGKKILGYVIDVMGPVTAPVYIIPYSSEASKDLHLEKGTKVYCAPSSKYTKYVVLQDLMKIRGSDASWVGDTEVPPEFQDFSDDEQEYLTKSSKKNNKRKHNQGQFEDTDRLPIETRTCAPNINRPQTGNPSMENKMGERKYIHPQHRNNQQVQSVINPAALESHNALPVSSLPAFNPNVPPPNFGAPPVFTHRMRNMRPPFYGVTPPTNFFPRGTNFGRSPHGMNHRQNMPGPHNGSWF